MDGCGKIPVRPFFTHLSIYDAKEHLRNVESVEEPELHINGELKVCGKCGSYHVFEAKFVNPNNKDVIPLDEKVKPVAWCMQLCRETTLVNHLDYVEKHS